MATAQIAVVDDDPDLRHLYTRALETAGYQVQPFSSGELFLKHIENQPDLFDLTVCDYLLQGNNGLDVFRTARKLGLRSPYLLVTAFGEFPHAVEALKSGVEDYLIKPIDPEVLIQKVSSYIQFRSLEQEVLFNRMGKNVVAESAAMQGILRRLSRVADSKASILFTGESGTGKEVLARLIHRISSRRDKKFVAVNVSAIPETLFEAQFFGYRKGAFTDAIRDHDGYGRMANDGTLFLDEVGELPAGAQAKLLRMLEERKVQPLGSTEVVPVNFRLVSATNRDPRAMIKDGSFREDLYYRIAVVSVHLPPLRERAEDILPLARFLLAGLAKEEEKESIDFTPQAQEKMLQYSWPGNVRELKNRIYEALLASKEKWIDEQDLDLPGLDDSAPKGKRKAMPYQKAKALFERRYLIFLLKKTGGNINRVAAISGLSRKTIYEMMKRHDVTPETYRNVPPP